MMGFLRDERGRIPFSVIGIFMILLSTAILLFLISAEHQNIITSAGQDRERGLADAMSLSSGDMETALNYAGMYAMSTVGENPVVNASADYEINGTGNHTADEVNLDRIRKLTLDRFTMYMENNYDGSFYYGDYNVTAVPTGDQSLVTVEPCNMTLTRTQFHPLKANDNYTAYYVLSVPVNVTIMKRGSDFNYSYNHNVSTMVTSRYPLLEELTGEYEGRMNGSDPTRPAPFFMDVTAGSFAYTWVFGYTQYAYGEPLNIISTNNTELLVNGANLVEQGAVYNSVDPVSVADFVLATLGKDEEVKQRNEYNMTNQSKKDLPDNKTGGPPKEYTFTIEDMLDRARSNLTCGVKVYGITTKRYMNTTVKGSYTCKMHMQIDREDLHLGYYEINETRIEDLGPISSFDNGEERIAGGSHYNVYVNESVANHWSQEVKIYYVVDDYSMLEYERLNDYEMTSPTLKNTHMDILYPYEETEYEYPPSDVPYAQYASLYDEPNAHYIVDNYEKVIDFNNRRDRILYNPSYSGFREVEVFVSGDKYQNYPPEWVELEADDEIQDLIKDINNTVHVTLRQEDYKDQPWAMTGDAYKQMQAQYNARYDKWLDRDYYEAQDSAGNYQGYYYSCSAKAIYHIRRAFLDDIKAQLDYAAKHAGTDMQNTIDQQMKDNNINMNSSDLTNNANKSNDYLNPKKANPDYPDTSLNIPFGLMMTMQSQREFDRNINYGWEENVTLIIDQKPAYLPMTYYENDEIGYKGYPIKTKNICLFSLPTDFINTDQITDAITAPVLDGIDAVAENVKELNNETVEREVAWVTENISVESKKQIKEQIDAMRVSDPELKDDFNSSDIALAVDNVYARRNGNDTQIAKDLRDGTIQEEIAKELSNKTRNAILNSGEERSEEYIDYMAEKTKDMVVRAEEIAVAKTIDKLSDNIKNAFTSYTKKALEKAEKEVLSEAMKKALGRVPNGLPLLPPWGWWATLNIWYIDVYGDIPYLAVYDTDTSIPNPIFGHEAQFYTRYNKQVFDDNLTQIGDNMPISFQTSTCTFIVVPPGMQGVGDKIGGWEEKSEGYDK
jgi:hypothetical protein